MKRLKFNSRFVVGFAGFILLFYAVTAVMFMPISIPRKTPTKFIPGKPSISPSDVPQQAAPAPQETPTPSASSQDVAVYPFATGETITYVIKSLKVNVGKATLTYHGIAELNGRKVYYIQFVATGMNFLDEEKIYASTDNFYPLMVRRDLNIWGKKEKIVEEYDHRQGTVKITKYVKDKQTAQTIKKDGLLDNIYCFIYRYRHAGVFQLGDSFLIRLPTRNVTIKLAKMTKLKTTDEQYDAYLMISKPSKYQVWFDTSDRKIPLKIKGTVGLNNTDMTMTSYRASL